MTPSQILELAKECGAIPSGDAGVLLFNNEDVIRFFHAAQDDAFETCAKKLEVKMPLWAGVIRAMKFKQEAGE